MSTSDPPTLPFCPLQHIILLPSCPLYTESNYYCPHKHGQLQAATPLKKSDSLPQQQSMANSSSGRLEPHESLSHQCQDSGWLDLYRSCAGNHSCHEFMRAMALSYPKDSI